MKWVLGIAVVAAAVMFVQVQRSNRAKIAELSAAIEAQEAARAEKREPAKEGFQEDGAAASVPNTPASQDPALRKMASEEADRQAAKSIEFSNLPAADREWVLQEASNSFLQGQVAQADLAQHIDELSNIRRLEVIDRTEMLTPEYGEEYVSKREAQ